MKTVFETLFGCFLLLLIIGAVTSWDRAIALGMVYGPYVLGFAVLFAVVRGGIRTMGKEWAKGVAEHAEEKRQKDAQSEGEDREGKR